MSAAACSCSSRRESWRPLTASCDTSSVKTEVKSGVPSMVSIVSQSQLPFILRRCGLYLPTLVSFHSIYAITRQ